MEKFAGQGVGFERVDLTDGFWKERQALVETVTVDAVYDRFAETGRFEALKGDWKEGMPNKPHIFWDSDVTKWIEGCAYFLKKTRNADLEARIDLMVDWMEQAQESDGYLNSYFTAVEPEARFTRRTDHELYCAGHLVEGAIAYMEATGKRKLLDIAIRYIDLIDRVFRIEHAAAFDTPGHEEIELALAKLYRVTGEERYRELAEYFLNTRGISRRDLSYDFTDDAYMQSHLPIRQQKTAEGHAVRALYLYCGMADLAMLNKEDALADTCEELFENITLKRMHITGGIGSSHRGETFTYDYDLPEYTTYNETCASIALAMFCRRMWLIRAEGKYADCAERALYNTVLSGISLSGDKFFYENPIGADPDRDAFNQGRPEGLKEHLPILERVKIFDCSCCPPNLIRAIGSLGDYMYSTLGNTIYTQCYMSGDANIRLEQGEVFLKQRTGYPYEGKVSLETETAGTYTIAVRIPGWCRAYELTVCGEKVTGTAENGYIMLARNWKKGDIAKLQLSMEAELTEANPNVKNMCGRVAVTRGPLVYCAEGRDNGDVSLKDIRIDREAKAEVIDGNIDGNRLPFLRMKADKRKNFRELYRPYQEDREPVTLQLIPYFAWANRGATEMNMWFLVRT